MKLCPYNRAREVQHFAQKNELDENGSQTGYTYDMTVEFFQPACMEELCGAWYDGRCHYASDPNNAP